MAGDWCGVGYEGVGMTLRTWDLGLSLVKSVVWPVGLGFGTALL